MCTTPSIIVYYEWGLHVFVRAQTTNYSPRDNIILDIILSVIFNKTTITHPP